MGIAGTSHDQVVAGFAQVKLAAGGGRGGSDLAASRGAIDHLGDRVRLPPRKLLAGERPAPLHELEAHPLSGEPPSVGRQSDYLRGQISWRRDEDVIRSAEPQVEVRGVNDGRCARRDGLPRDVGDLRVDPHDLRRVLPGQIELRPERQRAARVELRVRRRDLACAQGALGEIGVVGEGVRREAVAIRHAERSSATGHRIVQRRAGHRGAEEVVAVDGKAPRGAPHVGGRRALHVDLELRRPVLGDVEARIDGVVSRKIRPYLPAAERGGVGHLEIHGERAEPGRRDARLRDLLVVGRAEHDAGLLRRQHRVAGEDLLSYDPLEAYDVARPVHAALGEHHSVSMLGAGEIDRNREPPLGEMIGGALESPVASAPDDDESLAVRAVG